MIMKINGCYGHHKRKATLSFGRPQRTGVKRRDRSEREEHPCLSEASWDATASVGLEVARQRQP